MKNRTIAFCTAYVALIDVFSFFLSSIKNHYYVIGENYIGAEQIGPFSFLNDLLPEFINSYSPMLFRSIIPIVIISYFFISIVANDKESSVFNYVVIAIGGAVVIESIASVIGQPLKWSLISFSTQVSIIILAEFWLCRKFDTTTGFLFPLGIFISISMYHFICVLSTGEQQHTTQTLILPLIYLSSVYMLRAVQLWSRVSKKIKLRFLLSSLIVFFCALLLALSWVDYSSNGAFVRDWRQLYYVVIFSAFFLTFLTPYASVVFSRNRHDTDYSRQKKTSLLIASTLLIITPILCAFSVHGLVLIVLTSITLLIPYLVISNISINDANIDSKTWRALPFALLVFNFAYMAIDPILYINPSASLFPIVPILALFSAVLMFFFTVQSLTTKIGPIKLGKKLTSSLSKYRLDSPAPPYEITNQLITLFFNVFVLIIFYACYLVKDFIMHNRETFAFTFFDQPLGGLGGLYSLSWITLPVLINIFAILTSLMVFALRKVIAEEDTSENGESGTHE